MSSAIQALNLLSVEDAHAAFTRCCGASQWASLMVKRRPYADVQELFTAADTAWSEMSEPDFLEAFTHHPKIGANLDLLREKFTATKSWSSNEQGAVATASEETLLSLRDGNVDYEKRYGFIFIVCATGKSATEMLEILRSRMNHSYDEELQIAANEQAKITRLRLEKLEL